MKRAGWWTAGIAVAVAVIFLGQDLPLKSGLEAVIGWLQTLGPWAFFGAMAVLPLPLAWFTVPAGEAFAAQMSLGGVMAAALAAVGVQLVLSYTLARYALRPVIERLVGRRGIEVPRVTAENAVSVALLVRLTPGPPMILGSCVLAVAGVPFRLYLAVSWLVTVPWVVGGVVLGKGILSGNVKVAAAGICLFVAAFVAARWLRRRKSR